MRVQFTHSQEDLVDASMRFYARSKVLSENRRNHAIWLAIVAGFIVFALFGFSGKGLIGGMVTAVICLIVHPWYYRDLQRRGLRRWIKESYGDENDFLCTVELLTEGLKTSDVNIESTIPWETVEEIVTTSDSVDIFSRRGGVVVRNRAFSSAEQRQQFVEMVRDSMNQARGQKEP
jgi:hypothetical protein